LPTGPNKLAAAGKAGQGCGLFRKGGTLQKTGENGIWAPPRDAGHMTSGFRRAAGDGRGARAGGIFPTPSLRVGGPFSSQGTPCYRCMGQKTNVSCGVPLAVILKAQKGRAFASQVLGAHGFRGPALEGTSRQKPAPDRPGGLPEMGCGSSCKKIFGQIFWAGGALQRGFEGGSRQPAGLRLGRGGG